MLDKRRYAREHPDHLRTALMWEPRGHADMYGCLLTEPVTPDGNLGVIFLHNEGYSTMCGHAIIALTSVLPETGLVSPSEQAPVIRFDTPAGRVTARPLWKKGKIQGASFQNVPAFVYVQDRKVEVKGLGTIRYDVAYGGAFYVFCRASELSLNMVPGEFSQMVDLGMRIKRAVQDTLEIRHPFEKDLSFLYGTIFYGPPHNSRHSSRNVCVFAEGEVDRSPTGTGVSARAALHYARGEIKLGESFVIESILGTCFSGKAVKESDFGPYSGIIPEVSGRAHITGRHEFLFDPDDPLNKGFILR